MLLVAFCPMAYLFSAVYSESLFLALSLGCIWQARMGRWAWAGLLGALRRGERAQQTGPRPRVGSSHDFTSSVRFPGRASRATARMAGPRPGRREAYVAS